ncbi:hypothetical protein MPSEU_001055100 [Mayamaea pseudoterrestris]|nr:hypothetical protein MPSEU_001055100 [Mayamaea pseudoterrestris]
MSSTIQLFPSYPALPSLQSSHPSRSISPIPRPPSVPTRADKALYIARNRRQFKKGSNKKDKLIDADHSLSSSALDKSVCTGSTYDSLSSEDIIADLSAAEQSGLLAKLKFAVFRGCPSFDDYDDASTSTATSNSTLSEETFSNATSMLEPSEVSMETELLRAASNVLESPVSSRITILDESVVDEDEVLIHPVTPTPRNVRFDTEPPIIHHLTESIEQLSRLDKEIRWYSRRDIVSQRQDMKQAILTVRKHGSGTDLFINDMTLQPYQCATGCERYYSAENRFMGQKMMVESVVDNNGLPAEQLREISRNLSRPNREMALWHAKLNAIQCWGLAGLKLKGVNAAAPASTRPSKRPSPEATKNHSDFKVPKTTVSTCSPVLVPVVPKTPSPKRATISLSSSQTSDTLTLELPSLSDEGDSTDCSSSMDESSFYLAPRIVHSEDTESDNSEIGDFFDGSVGTGLTQQQPACQLGENQVYVNFNETLRKWQTLGESQSFASSLSGPSLSSAAYHSFDIGCGAFQ